MKTQLFATHQTHNAKMVNFGGYQLPVWYSSLKEEHEAVRNSAGIFDISHMGLLELSGPNAFEALQQVNCNNISGIRNQKMVYSMILNDAGGILDDVMVAQLSEDRYWMIVNAANTQKIIDWLNTHCPQTKINLLNTTHSFIAVQGPKTAQWLTQYLQQPFTAIPRFEHRTVSYRNHSIIASRTGYTGEDGFELLVPHAIVTALWEHLLKNGITPCGLGARDSLRLEAGLPLYGNELTEEITPYMTRYYKWVVKLDHDFIGKQALETAIKSEKAMTTVGLEMTERIIPRTGYPIQEGGKITSGTLSPTLNTPIAIAMIPQNHAKAGTELNVEIRGKYHTATVRDLPFI